MSRPQPRDLFVHPRDLLAEAVHDFGIHTVVDSCLALLEGTTDYDLLPVPLTYLAGAAARGQLRRGDLKRRGQDHWPRVWGARGLRYAWLPYAEPGVVAGLGDPAWRVREMCAKVAKQRAIGVAAEALVPLLHDEFLRVTVAAVRALGCVGEHEHAERIAALDPGVDPALVVAVDGAMRSLRVRLDRVL
ncbi:MAG: HEAT repeat domain-containing protein [Nocardioidaceae bacterium]